MKIDDLTLCFGDRTALDIAHLEFIPGASYAVIGHNGCGKSTLARCICGIIKPTSGSITYAPQDCVRYMPQRSYAFFGTTRNNILLGASGNTQAESHADMLIDQLSLGNVAHVSAKRLSGGETARMALARTVMGPATWLILDEPTSALDGKSTLAAERIIDEYRTRWNAGIILITHSLRQARRATDRIVFMEEGRVVEEGETDACLTRPQTSSLARFVEIFGS